MKKITIIIIIAYLIILVSVKVSSTDHNTNYSGVAYGGKIGKKQPIIIEYTEENLEKIKNLHLFTEHSKILSKNIDGSFTASMQEFVTEDYINPEPYALFETSCEILPVNTIYKGYDNQSKILREYQISTDTPLALSVKKRLENDIKNIDLCKEKKQQDLTERQLEKQRELTETLKKTCSKKIREITLDEYKQCKDNNLIK